MHVNPGTLNTKPVVIYEFHFVIGIYGEEHHNYVNQW
jgi:hypothetical protein